MNRQRDFIDSVRDPNSPPAIGCFLKSGAPTVVEALGNAPLDFLVADCQHATYDPQDVEAVTRAADLADLPVLVRLRNSDSEHVVGVLDAGAHGVVVPEVESDAEAERVVDRTRYEGSRSFAMSTRAGAYGGIERDVFLNWAEESTLVVAMIESRAGLEAVDDIAAVDGIDALMIGPADLSLDCGFDAGSAAFEDAKARIRAASAAAGFGLYVDDPGDVPGERSNSSFVVCGSELSHMASGLAELS
jgi:4-hydroxy-2-oxoheptanedioate aldolase